MLCAAFVFPESVNSQFIKRLQQAISPLVEGIRMQPRLLDDAATSTDYNADDFNSNIAAAEASLFPLTVTARLSKHDIS
jgi:hypothetical protein